MIQELIGDPPKGKKRPKNEAYIAKLHLASVSSLFWTGPNGLGLTDSTGYSLGSPYGLSNGIITYTFFAGMLKLKARSPAAVAQSVQALPYVGESTSEYDKADAQNVGDTIDQSVKELSLESTLRQYGFGKEQVAKITKIQIPTGEDELCISICASVKTEL